MTVNMKNAVMGKKRPRGRPKGRRLGRALMFYADDEWVASVDEWRARQPGFPNRSEAIRRLVQLGRCVGLGKAS